MFTFDHEKQTNQHIFVTFYTLCIIVRSWKHIWCREWLNCGLEAPSLLWSRGSRQSVFYHLTFVSPDHNRLGLPSLHSPTLSSSLKESVSWYPDRIISKKRLTPLKARKKILSSTVHCYLILKCHIFKTKHCSKIG